MDNEERLRLRAATAFSEYFEAQTQLTLLSERKPELTMYDIDKLILELRA